MMIWQLKPDIRAHEAFRGVGDYTFGSITFRCDADGFFEIENLPAEPLYAIARHISGEAKIKRGLPETPVREAAE